ncbi:MAG TPA: DNA topoisomerase I, partial [Xanthomonadaceae bacterium]|nr:DNA topoisomerase I [Xanthomonadaceae bacterium]
LGRYGPFAQIGTAEDEDKPKFASLRGGQSMHTITLEEAIKLFDLPRTLGVSNGETVTVAVGRFGPFAKRASTYASLGKEDDPYTISFERAVELIDAKELAIANRIIKKWDEAGVEVLNGKFGPYITNGSKNGKIPKDREPASLTLEECQAILEAAPEAKGRFGKKAAAKKAAVKKAATKA